MSVRSSGSFTFSERPPFGSIHRTPLFVGDRTPSGFATVLPAIGSMSPLFQRVVHADWSVDGRKRWLATAERRAGGWFVDAPAPVGPVDRFTAGLFDGHVLAGFDHPIGVPIGYGERTGVTDFRTLLAELGAPRWARFREPARVASEITVERPFYPGGTAAGVTQATLADALGVERFDALLRLCERAPAPGGRAACVLFWTLGGNQVGRAALAGWFDVLRPALARGASLWPFDGTLATLAARGGPVLAETYPAEAGRRLAVGFRPGESKRRPADRRGRADAIAAWAERHAVTLGPACRDTLEDGFGTRPDGEDRFDALVGLLGMLAVLDGHHVERSVPPDPVIDRWEGWILGR